MQNFENERYGLPCNDVAAYTESNAYIKFCQWQNVNPAAWWVAPNKMRVRMFVQSQQGKDKTNWYSAEEEDAS